jgi:hypothetical protein
MGSNNDMTRKDFLTLTFTLIGSTAVGAAACSSSNNAADGGGGHGGTTGTAGTSANGGHGGTTGAGATTGTGGGATGTAGNGAAGTGGGATCADPLPETMVADTTGHSHSVMVAASMLNATSAQMFDTTIAEQGTASAHMHSITLTPADLTTLKGGGNVTVMSTIVMSHGHMFMISCH